MRRWLPVLGLLMTAGATQAQAPVDAPAITPANAPIVTAGEEELREITIRALAPRYVERTRRDRIGRIWAPVIINGKGPFKLVLDTGASNSALMASVVEQLGIDANAQPKVRLRGVTGTAVVSAVRVDSMVIGDLLINSRRLPVIADAMGGAEGILGTEGLKDMRVHIDFRADLISITHSRGQPAPRGFHRVPLDLQRQRLPLMQASMGGIPVTAIINTGGQASIGNKALRDALLRRRIKTEPSVDIITGATSDTQTGEGYNAPPIHIGPLQIRNAHVTFGDMHIFEHWRMTAQPTILVAMDTLGQFDTLIIDYKLSEMQFRLPQDLDD